MLDIASSFHHSRNTKPSYQLGFALEIQASHMPKHKINSSR